MSARIWGERVSYAFKTLILRQHRPWLAGLVITDKCNLNCHYCESKNNGQYHFTWPEMCQALDAAYRGGCRSLYFTGGEPTAAIIAHPPSETNAGAHCLCSGRFVPAVLR